MQKYIIFIALIILLSACSYGTYELNKGLLNIETKPSYNVTYNVLASNNASISYTDESGSQKILEKISGDWEKNIVLKSGQKVQFIVDSKDKQLSSVLVDQKAISTISKTGKTAHYSLSFVLP
ncbi:hypothetical protein EZ456_00790 [Pedobacter psychrodurus]|uniref:Lipoprotein n=1 Tax=Pedobacter psychrodurus TaxID=2530456 RepID=A0A4V2MRG2_9SPHI|nr:hypothetical protein [Pedobacter psychrodurus]TCD29584.1 hypothetical protein EZ456_00790 [Pedobacter psychrodurus]